MTDLIQQALALLEEKDTRVLFKEARIRRARDEEDDVEELVDKGPEHNLNILNQLKKVVDSNGSHLIQFNAGSGKFDKVSAKQVLDAVMKLKPDQRAKAQEFLQKSAANLKNFSAALKKQLPMKEECEFEDILEEVMVEGFDWGYASKSQFKRAEMEHELRDEAKAVKSTLKRETMYRFYKVNPDNEDIARQLGLTKTKSGKWALSLDTTLKGFKDFASAISSRPEFSKMVKAADEKFGKSKWWSSNSNLKEEVEGEETLEEATITQKELDRLVKTGEFVKVNEVNGSNVTVTDKSGKKHNFAIRE
jgi:hypothetical protein